MVFGANKNAGVDPAQARATGAALASVCLFAICVWFQGGCRLSILSSVRCHWSWRRLLGVTTVLKEHVSEQLPPLILILESPSNPQPHWGRDWVYLSVSILATPFRPLVSSILCYGFPYLAQHTVAEPIAPPNPRYQPKAVTTQRRAL